MSIYRTISRLCHYRDRPSDNHNVNLNLNLPVCLHGILVEFKSQNLCVFIFWKHDWSSQVILYMYISTLYTYSYQLVHLLLTLLQWKRITTDQILFVWLIILGTDVTLTVSLYTYWTHTLLVHLENIT